MTNQMDLINKINEKQKALTQDWMQYWNQYSSFDTWQFWFQVVLFVAPLVILYFKLDRSKALLVGFYGFNVHVWLAYIDRFGINSGYWEYPYQFFILIPNSVSLDASLVPVSYMLLYQWIVANKKNYYLYTILLSASLSFIFKPLLNLHYFMKFYISTPYFYLFLGYILILVLSKIITDVFVHFQKEERK